MANLENLRTLAVLPAAGCGERFGNSVPKQYTIIKGKPLLCYAVEGLLKLDYIEKVVLVVDNVESAHALLQPYFMRTGIIDLENKVIYAEGSGSRHRSIFAGLKHILQREDPPDIIVVHDAVRPFIPPDLNELIKAALNDGAAGYVRPLVSTVIKPRLEEHRVEQVLQRNLYRASETPQAFRWEILWDSYCQADDKELDEGTECLQLALKYEEVSARLLPGGEQLWKVTYPKDLTTAKSMLNQNNVVFIDRADVGVHENLVTELTGHFASVCSSRIEMPSKAQHCVAFCESLAHICITEYLRMLDSSEDGNLVLVSSTSIASDDGHLAKFSGYGEKYRKSLYFVHFDATNNRREKLVNLIRTLLMQTDDALSGQCFKV